MTTSSAARHLRGRHSLSAPFIGIDARPAWLLLPVFLLLTGNAGAQGTPTTSQQFWFDYDPTFVLSRKWSLDAEVTFHMSPNAMEPWREGGITPNFEYALLRSVDITGGSF